MKLLFIKFILTNLTATSLYDNLEWKLYSLLFFSTDEVATDRILKGMRTFASVSGQLEKTSQRDAFISAICKSAVPTNYHATVLSSVINKEQNSSKSSAIQKSVSTDSTSAGVDRKDETLNGHTITVSVYRAMY